jgi:hypothetical protein
MFTTQIRIFKVKPGHQGREQKHTPLHTLRNRFGKYGLGNLTKDGQRRRSATGRITVIRRRKNKCIRKQNESAEKCHDSGGKQGRGRGFNLSPGKKGDGAMMVGRAGVWMDQLMKAGTGRQRGETKQQKY